VLIAKDAHLPLLKFNKNFIKIIGPAPKLNEEELEIMQQIKLAEENKEMRSSDPEVKPKEVLRFGLNKSEEFLLFGGVFTFVCGIVLLGIFKILRQNKKHK